MSQKINSQVHRLKLVVNNQEKLGNQLQTANHMTICTELASLHL